MNLIRQIRELSRFNAEVADTAQELIDNLLLAGHLTIQKDLLIDSDRTTIALIATQDHKFKLDHYQTIWEVLEVTQEKEITLKIVQIVIPAQINICLQTIHLLTCETIIQMPARQFQIREFLRTRVLSVKELARTLACL